MKLKKILSTVRAIALLPVLALAISILSIISCSNVTDQKNKTAETQQVIPENKVDAKAITNLPPGDIALNKLPAGVKNFIENNYNGYTMVNAASDPLCDGAPAIDVAITKDGSPNLSLIFKPDGSFVQQEQDIPLTEATGKIKNALKAKYPGYVAGNQIEKLILADKLIQYLVDLSKGNATKEVIFTADGNVVCEN